MPKGIRYVHHGFRSLSYLLLQGLILRESTGFGIKKHFDGSTKTNNAPEIFI
jgi:hypothetical protein